MSGEPIVIVDDNATNLKVLRVLLETEGYDVRTATDGKQLAKVLATFRPRLVFMDLQLPGVDGLELARQLRRDPATRDIVIVAITAYAMKTDAERALREGCDGYVAKPIDTRLLPRLVKDFLTRRSPPGGAP